MIKKIEEKLENSNYFLKFLLREHNFRESNSKNNK